MRVTLTSVMVDDQDKALRFYTEVLGFEKKMDFDTGGGRWLTVISPASPDVQVVLEPTGHPASKVFQKALFDDGIPLTTFRSDDLLAEHARLKAQGVVFREEPKRMGMVINAVFEDTCGNLIGLHQLA